MSLLATRSSALSWLLGARVQRVDSPVAGCLSLTLFQPSDKRSLLLLFGAQSRGIGSVSSRPKGLAASPFVQRLRTSIDGARLHGAEWLFPAEAANVESSEAALALLLTFTRGDATCRIAADFDATCPNLFLLREDDTIAAAADERLRRERFPQRAAAYALGRGRGVQPPADDEALKRAGEQLLANSAQRGQDTVRIRLQAQTRAALKRVERKLAAIEGDIARADAAPRLRREAQALLCALSAVPRGASTVRLADPSSEPPCEIEIALDPAKDALQNAEQRFQRARKLERGVAIASARLRATSSEADALRAKLAALASSDADLSDHDGADGARSSVPATGARKKPQTRTPYRRFIGHAERHILVGKSAADNDALTLTVARPHDQWLHVRGVHGSHVVVPLDRKASLPQELLLDAAHLAAHFSKARGERLVEIAHTERRFVRKPKGAAPGSVNVDRERVFVLRVEPERIARLLANERV